MRIAIVTTSGVTRQFRQWPEAILGRALVARGHTVAAFTLLEEGSDITGNRHEDVDGIDVRRVPVNKLWLAPGLWPRLLAFRPDVIHLFHLRNALNWQATLLGKLSRTPVVFTVVGPFHDPFLVDDRERPYLGKMYPGRLIYSVPRLARSLLATLPACAARLRQSRLGHPKSKIQNPKSKIPGPLATWQNWCMHFPLKHADRLIALSRHEVSVLKRLRLDPGKIARIPLWIDAPYINSVPFGVSLAAGYPSPHVLFLGQLKERKGFDTLAEAMPHVLERCPTTTFLFAGQNPARAGQLQAICSRNGTLDHLVLLGRVSEEDKVRLMRSADCLVYPTRYESFGLPPLEAMAAGCPVVASDIPVVSEMIQNGENGILVPPESPQALAEGIVRVLTDPSLRTHLVEGGGRTLFRYAEQPIVDQIEALYRRLGDGTQ